MPKNSPDGAEYKTRVRSSLYLGESVARAFLYLANQARSSRDHAATLPIHAI
jgi:hypothetical protein